MQTSKLRSRVAAAIAASLSLASAPPTLADYFLKIDGIEGESTAKGHEKEIEVLSWSWGVSQSSPSSSASARGSSSRPCVNDISFTKLIDKASPLLMADAVMGMPLPRALFTARKAGSAPVEYLKLELKNILVSSYHGGSSGGDGFRTEEGSFQFGAVTVEYTRQKPDGSAGDVVRSSINGGC